MGRSADASAIRSVARCQGMRSLPVIAAILVAACTAPSTAPAPADGASAPGLRATFILANAAGLVALDSSCRALGRIVELKPVEAPSTPALHPDGSRLAFAVTRDSATAGFGTDIVEVKLDGTGLRTLLEHDAENVFYASPRYDPGGTAIYVHRRAAVIRDGAYVGNEDTIERVDLATGQRRTVVRDAADPAISPNGARLVYVKLRDSQPETLWTASLPEGADARPFFRANETFFWVMTPRFSPSGDRVLFSAAGRALGGEAAPPLQRPGVHARELGSRGMATTAVYSEVLRGGLRPPAGTPRVHRHVLVVAAPDRRGEHAVDELRRGLRAEELRELDGLVDDHARGRVAAVAELVERDAQDIAVDARHLVDRELGREGPDLLVEVAAVLQDALDDVPGEGAGLL